MKNMKLKQWEVDNFWCCELINEEDYIIKKYIDECEWLGLFSQFVANSGKHTVAMKPTSWKALFQFKIKFSSKSVSSLIEA